MMNLRKILISSQALSPFRCLCMALFILLIYFENLLNLLIPLSKNFNLSYLTVRIKVDPAIYKELPKYPVFRTEKKNTAIDDIYLIILSAWDHFEQRQMIRDTWARDTKNYKFILGGQYCSIKDKYRNTTHFWRKGKRIHVEDLGCYLADEYDQEIPLQTGESKSNYSEVEYQAKLKSEYSIQLINEEQQLYDDIYIAENLVETYQNLTAKLKAGINYVIQEKREKEAKLLSDEQKFPSLLMKIDDDTLVLLPELLENINAKFPKSERSGLYLGHNNPVQIPIKISSESPREYKWGDGDYNGNPRYKIPQPVKEVAERCDVNISNRKFCNKEPNWNNQHKSKQYPTYMNGNCGYLISMEIAEWIDANAKNLTDHTCEDLSVGIWLEYAQATGQLPPITYLENGFYRGYEKVAGGENWFGQSFQYHRTETCSLMGKPRNKRPISGNKFKSVVSLGHRMYPHEISKCYSYYLCNSRRWDDARCESFDPESDAYLKFEKARRKAKEEGKI